jgi:putative transcriptional regulator
VGTTPDPTLAEVIDLIDGKPRYRRRFQPQPIDVARLRRRLNLRQVQFAARFGISVATLRHWEHGDRAPRGPALVLLNLIARNPRVAMRLLPLPPVEPPMPPRVHKWEGLFRDFRQSDPLDEK